MRKEQSALQISEIYTELWLPQTLTIAIYDSDQGKRLSEVGLKRMYSESKGNTAEEVNCKKKKNTAVAGRGKQS